MIIRVNKAYRLPLVALMGLLILSGAVYLLVSKLDLNQEPSVCSLEAMVCPDGSLVGRQGDNCDFSPCLGSVGEEVAWLELKQAVLDCRASSIAQTHDLRVSVTLRNGDVMYAQEPEIDDIMDIYSEAREKCWLPLEISTE